MRRKIVAGNWKMNTSLREGEELLRNLLAGLSDRHGSQVIIAPPFTHLPSAAALLKGSGIELGAQNCSSEESGAYTGEISAGMIKSTGAAWVIIGHSERRTHFKENNDVLLKKVKCALKNNLLPIYCIGELLADREAGMQQEIVGDQLKEVLFKLSPEEAGKVILAYEPVWAIGTGKTATPSQAQEMHQFIRRLVAEKMGNQLASQMRMLYGGSCNAKNAAELFAQPDVDGGLIGGASLKAEDFISIIKAAG